MRHDFARELQARMPQLRGTLTINAPLAPLTWFRTGGEADVLFEPADAEDLASFLSGCPAETPLLMIGAGSNLLVRDGGVAGVAIRLGRGFATIAIEGDTVTAGAGVHDVKLASAAAQAGLAGFSFLRGIPGTIGGAIRMNGGAYGGDMAGVTIEARGIDRSGASRSFTAGELGFTYRHCGIAADVIFTEARLRGHGADPATIRADMAAITASRAATQPVNTRTGGSTFKNPPGAKAWELIDRAGCRGLVHGDAQVSELHTNFLVNRGRATAQDLEELGEMVRQRVRDMSGIDLEWEIARVGRPASAAAFVATPGRAVG